MPFFVLLLVSNVFPANLSLSQLGHYTKTSEDEMSMFVNSSKVCFKIWDMFPHSFTSFIAPQHATNSGDLDRFIFNT